MEPLKAVFAALAIIAVLIIVLFFLPVRLNLCYSEKLKVRLRILCFSFSIYPRKKKWKMKDHLPEYQKKSGVYSR